MEMKKEFVIKFGVYQKSDDPKILVRIAKGQCVNESNTYKEALIKTILYVFHQFDAVGKHTLLNECDVMIEDDSTVNGAYIQYWRVLTLLLNDEFLRTHYFSQLTQAGVFNA